MAGEKILIVDDEPDIVTTISIALRQEGYNISTAVNGEETLGKVNSVKPDLIVLDVMLPDIKGDEVARRIRLEQDSKAIPIILITAFVQKCEVENLMNNAYVDVCLKKPFELQELADKIKELLGSHKHSN